MASPPPESHVSNTSSDEDFMRLFFSKNNKKSFMPKNTKISLLFDLLDNMDIAKFGARGHNFQDLQMIWSKKKMSKAKQSLYSLNLVFDDLLTINNFLKNNQHLNRLRSNHSLLHAVVNAMEDCCKKARLDFQKQGEHVE